MKMNEDISAEEQEYQDARAKYAKCKSIADFARVVKQIRPHLVWSSREKQWFDRFDNEENIDSINHINNWLAGMAYLALSDADYKRLMPTLRKVCKF